MDGLDEILGGGLPRGELHVVQGGPGTGKTTLGLQFLLAGAARGERVAFVSLSQTRRALETIAASHGWSLRGVEVRERAAILSAREGAGADTVPHRRRGARRDRVGAAVGDRADRARPGRDRLDRADPAAGGHGTALPPPSPDAAPTFSRSARATVLVSDGQARGDEALSDLSHGTIVLERNIPDYGNVRRRLHVAEMRGVAFHGGNHNFRIRTGGLDVFPSLEPGELGDHEVGPTLASGSQGLDALLGGGLDEGTACMLVGPTGTGKDLGRDAPRPGRGEARRARPPSSASTSGRRPSSSAPRGSGRTCGPWSSGGLISIRAVETAQLSPGEFAQRRCATPWSATGRGW